MRSFLLTLFTVIFVVALFMLTSCVDARIQRHLRRANIHLLKAKALGAHLDSLKTVIHDTITVTSINDNDSTIAKVDTTQAVNACAELLSTMANITSNQKKVIDSLVRVKTKNPIKYAQKAFCPDDSIDKVIDVPFTVGAHKYKIPVHLRAWSIAGKAGYDFKVFQNKFEYEKETITTEVKPNESRSNWYWFLIVGIFIGVIGMILIRRI